MRMFCRIAACAFAAALVPTALAASARASVDPASRTVTTSAFQVQFSPTDPEEITSLSWDGSPNLTNTWVHPFCPAGGASEFFGNSWDAPNDVNFRALVGWGSVGSWAGQGPNGVSIASSASGCFGTLGTPVSTSYHFFDGGGPNVNRFLVTRRIAFGDTPFSFDLRPYIPRLYPRDRYGLVIHPNAAGTALVTEVGNDCEFGCQVTDWNGTWFAVHDPISGQGMIVKHEFSSYQVALWVDMDGGSQTTASSVELLAPPGGFTGTVAETEALCFYSPAIWTPSLSLPAGC
jgi:hypothetical protein